jgi:hypothetical protein
MFAPPANTRLPSVSYQGTPERMTAVSGPAAAAAAAASATTSAGIRILVCNFNSRLFG